MIRSLRLREHAPHDRELWKKHSCASKTVATETVVSLKSGLGWVESG
jgi:hypothetical protein